MVAITGPSESVGRSAPHSGPHLPIPHVGPRHRVHLQLPAGRERIPLPSNLLLPHTTRSISPPRLTGILAPVQSTGSMGMEPERDGEEQCRPLLHAPAAAEQGHQQQYQYLGRSSSSVLRCGSGWGGAGGPERRRSQVRRLILLLLCRRIPAPASGNPLPLSAVHPQRPRRRRRRLPLRPRSRTVCHPRFSVSSDSQQSANVVIEVVDFNCRRIGDCSSRAVPIWWQLPFGERREVSTLQSPVWCYACVEFEAII
jgi:hypothetical protein